MYGRLQNKVAIVTGASNGVGEATARRFAQEGCSVVLCARQQDLLDVVVADIEAAGGRAKAFCGDITNEATVTRLVAETVTEFDRLDILVNNANALVPGMLADHELADWRQSFAIAVEAPMLLMREAYEHLARNQGAVVNVSSICGQLAAPGLAGYSAAKSGLQALTRNAAVEWASQNIRVNAIVIGVVATPATEAALPDLEARRITASQVPLGRIGRPEEAASAILFLASDEASYITGAALPVDGGKVVALNTGAAGWET